MSERTIRRWIAAGILHTVKRAGVTHVDPAEMERAANYWKARTRARPRVTLTSP